MDHLTDRSVEVINEAQKTAIEHSHSLLSPLHVTDALFSSKDGLLNSILSKTGLDPVLIERKFKSAMLKLPTQSPPPSEVAASPKFNHLLQAADKLRKSQRDSHLAVDHLILALLEDQDILKIFTDNGVTKKGIESSVAQIRGSRHVDSKSADSSYEALSKYAVDLVELASQGKLDPVIGRDEEIRRVIQVLCRKTKNNPVLIGEPGVGKTAIAEGLAQRILAKDVPESLNCKLFSLDLGLLIAGAKYRGEFEERLKSILKEIADSNGGIILFIDEIHLVLGAGKSEGAMDAANLLKPMLARGELRLIGATTLMEYQKHVEKDAAFERRLQQVKVQEPSVESAISILRGLKDKYESHHGVKIMDAALVSAVVMSNRYITNRFLPDKAIDLMDEACANTRVQLDSQPEEIDILERQLMQLEIEATALAKEKDKPSKERLEKVQKEISKLKDELAPLHSKYQNQKGKMDEIRDLKTKRDQLSIKLTDAERRRDLALAADLRYGALPDLEKKIAQLETLSASVQSDMLSQTVTPEKITEIVSRTTGIPVQKLSKSQTERLLGLADVLHKRIIGQNEAVTAVSEAVLRSRAGLSSSNQPIGSFLFLGPTGVGKTELAKSLASELFDDEKFMVRIDMSEYMEAHTVARLVGAPPGYVGFDEGGQLTEVIRRKPYSVILFDEIEKAHPQVLNILLQVLDDGRLTDGKGRLVNFTNTVIIMTSNVGSHHLMLSNNTLKRPIDEMDTEIDEISQRVRDLVMQETKKTFKPELLNRITDIVIFQPLNRVQLREIVILQVQLISKRLQSREGGEKKIVLTLTVDGADVCLEKSFDPSYGARPVRRWLEKHVVTGISKMVLKGEVPDRC